MGAVSNSFDVDPDIVGGLITFMGDLLEGLTALGMVHRSIGVTAEQSMCNDFGVELRGTKLVVLDANQR
jgi:hypothetical protein